MNEILECIFCILISFFSAVGILTICSAIYLVIKEKQDWGVKRQRGIRRSEKRAAKEKIKKEKEDNKYVKTRIKKEIRSLKKAYFNGEYRWGLYYYDQRVIDKVIKYLIEHNFGEWIILSDGPIHDTSILFNPKNYKDYDRSEIKILLKNRYRKSIFSSKELRDYYTMTEEKESDNLYDKAMEAIENYGSKED